MKQHTIRATIQTDRGPVAKTMCGLYISISRSDRLSPLVDGIPQPPTCLRCRHARQ